jgi:molecular chaperone GrpE
MTDDRITEGTPPEAEAAGGASATSEGDQAQGDGSGGAPVAPPAAEVAEGPATPGFHELEQMTAERDDYLDQLRRVSAEFANYKKRVARDQQALVDRATERLVKELLPVFDDLERALVAFEAHDEAQVAKGVELVHRALKGVLEKEGIVAIEPAGQPFDPHVHEALLSQPSDQPEGTVIEVIQKGFQLGDRVVRPARVVVAAAKE